MKQHLQLAWSRFSENPVRWKQVLVAGVVIRFAFLFASGQWPTDEYWEYGQIARLLAEGKGYSFSFVDEELRFLPDAWYPSALMPPGYVFFLYPFLLIQDLALRNLLLFAVQMGISAGAMGLFYRYALAQAGPRVAMAGLLLQAFTPDLIFAPCSIGPTVFFHFFFSAFFVLNLGESRKSKFLLQGLLAGILVLFRSETLLFFGAYALWQCTRRQFLAPALVVLPMVLLISPWLVRNTLTFGKPILSASMGLNFYRGNNPGAIGDWPPQFDPEVLAFRKDPGTYEANFDRFALTKALDWIRSEPGRWLARLPEKAARFWLLDWEDPRSRSPLYWMPWFITLLAGLNGIRKAQNRRHFPEILLLLGVYTLIVLVFFPQLRYLTLIKFFGMPFAALGLQHLWSSPQKKPEGSPEIPGI
jgi:hypothetical protein